ncbi:esterase-like activity of phytase family protein, partial [Corynebacterium bovis]
TRRVATGTASLSATAATLAAAVLLSAAPASAAPATAQTPAPAPAPAPASSTSGSTAALTWGGGSVASSSPLPSLPSLSSPALSSPALSSPGLLPDPGATTPGGPQTPTPPAAGPVAELVDTHDLAGSTVEHGDGPAADAPFGGISGIDRIAGDRYIGISDDRSEKGPARAYPLTLPRTATGGTGTATIGAPVTLTDADGKPYARGTVDPESIRVTPGGDLLWSSEGDADAGIAPAVTLAGPDGQARLSYTIPEYHRPGPGRGIRNNQAYEGLTLTDGGRSAVVLTEGPLQQDSRNRLTVYDTATGMPRAEYAYQLDPADPGADGRGATEILAVGDGTFLTLERGYVPGQGTRGKLYRVRPGAATDVLGRPTLDGREVTVEKEELLDFSPHGENPDNIEGMTWGPDQPDGRRTLLVTTDDNFSRSQRSLVHTVALRL